MTLKNTAGKGWEQEQSLLLQVKGSEAEGVGRWFSSPWESGDGGP